MPVFDANDAEIYYEVDGDGPPLILIAGLASDVASWLPVRAALAAHFRLIMPDNRGAGRTRAKRGLEGLTIGAMAGDIVQLTDSMKLEGCAVVGHSMGAAIAVEATLRRPALARKLVLAGAGEPNPRASAVVSSLAAFHARTNGDADWLRAFFPWLFAPAFLENPAVVEAAVAASLAYPHRPTTEMFVAQVAAARAHVPSGERPAAEMLVLSGEDDLLFPPAACRAFANRFGAGHTEIAGAAHSLFWDRPEAAAAAVIGFCAE